jgi:hypothetical protein
VYGLRSLLGIDPLYMFSNIPLFRISVAIQDTARGYLRIRGCVGTRKQDRIVPGIRARACNLDVRTSVKSWMKFPWLGTITRDLRHVELSTILSIC